MVSMNVERATVVNGSHSLKRIVLCAFKRMGLGAMGGFWEV
jgi:hypothetical protein